jgi:polyisoprenoid-binding protein YceI
MTATHIVDGVEVPVAGTWSIDPGHTEVAFIGRHLGLTKTRGRFTGVDGTVQLADDPTESTIDITIDMKTVDSGLAQRDDSLRSANWFDVDNHPTARFRSTAITIDGTGGAVTGDLTIKGITRPVVLDVEYLGFAQDPWGNDRAAFSANATINREDWGVTNSMALDNGRLLVSKRIRLEIELELVRQPEPTD